MTSGDTWPMRLGGSAPASRPGIGEHAAAPYMRAWDAIVSAGASQRVRRLLDATDAAGAAGLN